MAKNELFDLLCDGNEDLLEFEMEGLRHSRRRLSSMSQCFSEFADNMEDLFVDLEMDALDVSGQFQQPPRVSQ